MKKQKIERTYSGIKMESLNSAIKALSINGSHSKKNIKSDNGTNLNNSQKKAYHDIRGLMAEKRNAVILIDALSGTGKTFLLSSLAANSADVQFIAFRRDQASDVSSKGILSKTCVSFCMKYLDLKYRHAICMFNGKNKIEQLYNLIKYSQKYHHCTKTIMVDTYTIAPPQMLLLLYIIALKNHIHLIFAGSSLQLNAIYRSRLHGQNNFSILQIFNDMTVKKLSPNMRVRDPDFETKLSNFLKALQYREPCGQLMFHFNLRYKLYYLFRSKYFTEERFDTVYVARTHALIKKRLIRFTDYLKTTGTRYVEAPFFYFKGNEKLVVPTRSSNKFYSYLILAEGYKYIHISTTGVNSIVELVEILYENDAVHSLLVRYVNKQNELFKIEQCSLNYYQILPAYRSWLLKDVKHTGELIQFPLRQYALTYHSAIGRTIKTEDVELNADCAYANCMYIGLSCVRRDAGIHKIHTERDLLGYVVTEYMEQEHADFEYYYRCPNEFKDQILEYVSNKGINKFIENIVWIDVENVNTFEAKTATTFLRIKRSVYKPSASDKESFTPLMEVAKFIKEKPNVILNTINMVSVEALKQKQKDNVKKRKSGSQKSEKENESEAVSPSYAYLKKEYDTWVDLNKKEI